MGVIKDKGMWMADLYDLLSNAVSLVNTIRSILTGTMGFLTAPTLSIGTSSKTKLKNAAFTFSDGYGTRYVSSAETVLGSTVIPQSKYGAVALDIGSDGTIDAVEATGNSTGYTTAALALAAIPQVASGHIRLGTITIIKSDGAFTLGTTNLDAANVTTSISTTTNIISIPSALSLSR